MASKHWLHLITPYLNKYVERGLYFTGLLPQGHCFCWFFYNYVHFSCLWWLETYLDPNTDLYQNTSRDYRIIIKGTEGLYPIDTNIWWYGLGLGFIEESAKVFAKSKVKRIVAKAAKTCYYHQFFFIHNLTLLWPWDDLIIWSERNYRKTEKTWYFQFFSVDLTLSWPLDELAMTLGYPKVMAMSKYNISVLFEGGFGVGLYWDLGLF